MSVYGADSPKMDKETIRPTLFNINQIATRVNSTDKIYAEDIEEIRQKQEEIGGVIGAVAVIGGVGFYMTRKRGK